MVLPLYCHDFSIGVTFTRSILSRASYLGGKENLLWIAN